MMLTDKETLVIAERYLQRLSKRGKDIEVMIYLDEIIKKPYGNIYFYNSKEYILTGNFNKSLVGNAPFLVEKKNRESGWFRYFRKVRRLYNIL